MSYEWHLTAAQIAQWKALYPGLDVEAECRKALAWVQTNNRKTARGMPRFLVGWLNRANDRRPSGNGHPNSRAETIDERMTRVLGG